MKLDRIHTLVKSIWIATISIVGISVILGANFPEGKSSSNYVDGVLANEFITLRPHGDSNLSKDEISTSPLAPWAFPVQTLDIVDSYIPFLFRTKKSAAIDELMVLISINEVGRISNYEVLNKDADRGLKERVGHVVRNLPNAVPVPGFSRYDPMDFELIIKK
jgi:hypothetical protein